jgi:hypothetical protein
MYVSLLAAEPWITAPFGATATGPEYPATPMSPEVSERTRREARISYQSPSKRLNLGLNGMYFLGTIDRVC